jgi:hypothetical protein
MKYKGKISKFNQVTETLKQKVETVEFHIKQLEQAGEVQFDDTLNLVAKSWKELDIYLGTD